MRYLNATQILPTQLLEQVQQYVDGEYLYIPRLPGHKQNWGSNTATRQELPQRNSAIAQDYRSGMSLDMLSEKYFLTPKSIRRILSRMDP